MSKELDTKLLDRLIDRASKGTVTARIGYFDDSGVHPRTKKTAGDIATINNNGAPKANIPERPFVTDGAYEGEIGTRNAMVAGYEKFQRGQTDLKTSLRKAAEVQKFRINQKLQEAPFVYKENAPYTEEKKGFNRPLLETGWLEEKIDIKVYEGD